MSKKENARRGRPETRIIQLDATPEEIARRICENARPSKPAPASNQEIDKAPVDAYCRSLAVSILVTYLYNSPINATELGSRTWEGAINNSLAFCLRWRLY